MTVSELITRLQGLRGDDEVCVQDGDDAVSINGNCIVPDDDECLVVIDITHYDS